MFTPSHYPKFTGKPFITLLQLTVTPETVYGNSSSQFPPNCSLFGCNLPNCSQIAAKLQGDKAIQYFVLVEQQV